MEKPDHKPHDALSILPVMNLYDYTLAAYRGSQYHLSVIDSILSKPEFAKFLVDKNSFTEEEKYNFHREENILIWHIRAFFWELISTFDIMLEWANQKYSLGIPVDKVRWNTIRKASLNIGADHDKWLEKYSLLSAAYDSDWFYEIKRYRNFAHRSFLGVQIEVDTDYGRSEPKIHMVSLLPAREGQTNSDYLIECLKGYLQHAADLIRGVLEK